MIPRIEINLLNDKIMAHKLKIEQKNIEESIKKNEKFEEI
jgi:hypothetical protein